MIKIDFMNNIHLDSVAELEKQCFSDPWSRKSFEGEIENGFTVYLVAQDGEKIIGYAGMWCVLGDGNITNVAVTPEYRRRKIGSALLERLLQEAYERNTEYVYLEVRKSNQQAQQLYKKFGFENVGVRKAYYADNGEDALLMERKIDK